MQHPWVIEAIEWAVVYPVHVEPIGHIHRRARAFHATFADEHLGAHPTGDRAVEAIWARFLESSRVRHQIAAQLHGGRERHRS